jgi:branched-chain amino acid transport system ATP-binding protein
MTSNGSDAIVPLLECRRLSAGYGQIGVIHEIDLAVGPGEVVALLGPNGAGKTTTLLTLAGEIVPSAGEVLLGGRPTQDAMYRRCREGLGLITEERSVIMALTAAENLRIANVAVDDATELFPALRPLLGRRAGLLSGGEQQMLTLARALCRRPNVLLADELSLGLAPLIVSRLLGELRKAAREHGVGVLFVEQHVRQALTISDRVYLMQHGRITLAGSADEVRQRLPEIEDAYLSAGLGPRA